MNVLIRAYANGRTTLYEPSQLAKDARLMVKGKGKLVGYYVAFNEGGGAQLCANYAQADGWNGTATQAL